MIRKHSIQYILLALLAGNLAFTSCSDSMVEEKMLALTPMSFSVIGVVRLKPDGEAHKTSSIWMPDMLCRKQTGIVSTVLLRNVMR